MSAVLEVQPRLRDMRETDVAEVMRIERAAYEFPWTEGILRDCFRFGYLCKVYELPEALLGYGILSVAAGECHVLNICIDPTHQRLGHGSRLVAHLLRIARDAGARTALLEVRVSNATAFRLYHRMGFNEIGQRKAYYPAHIGREDALVLAREL